MDFNFERGHSRPRGAAAQLRNLLRGDRVASADAAMSASVAGWTPSAPSG